METLGLVREKDSSLESGYRDVEMTKMSGQLHLDHRDNVVVSAHISWPEFILRSVCTVLLRARIKVLLPFGPLAIFVNYFYGDPWKSVTSTTFSPSKLSSVVWMGLLPQLTRNNTSGRASRICNRVSIRVFSQMLVQIAYYSGPTVGGLLNATFGNATEMIVSVFALKSGMIRVIQQSLLGSILSNLLMVLGCAFFIGGIFHHDKKVQVFNKAAAVVDCGFLLVSVMGITIPAVLHATKTEFEIGKSELSLSRFSSCMMLLAYAAYLFFQLKSHQSLYNPINEACKPPDDVLDEECNGKVEEEVPEISKLEAISWLAILTLWVSVLSGYLVDAIQFVHMYRFQNSLS
ncbi:Vacuolar cation/proton exchanger 2 [Linum perenne]